jgi:hypothetical protein
MAWNIKIDIELCNNLHLPQCIKKHDWHHINTNANVQYSSTLAYACFELAWALCKDGYS